VRRLQLAAVLTGLGALMTCGTARALVPPEPTEEAPSATRSAPALALLESAASVAQAQVWTGTERVLSLVSGAPVVTVSTVEHGPGRHSATDALDSRLFSLLATHYELRITGPAEIDGHTARVVEARRPGGDALLAGRFWVDADSGMLLRREVMDATGALLRRSDLVGVHVGGSGTTTAALPSPHGARLDTAALDALEADGWPVPRFLPGDLDLFDARWLSDGVLQLAFSDGLSTLSLFVQRGEMPATTTGVVRRVAGGVVWEAAGEPERVVWAAEGCTWTLVADVAPSLVDEVLLALPHTSHQVTEDGLAPRVWRGMARVGAWLNPFH